MDTIITNNPLVRQTAVSGVFLTEDVMAVLRYARDMIHRGYRLVIHPLSGNIRPERLRYKTLVLSGPEDSLDMSSLELIEAAIAAVGRRSEAETPKEGPGGMDDDLRLIDAAILFNALPALFAAEPAGRAANGGKEAGKNNGKRPVLVGEEPTG